VISQDAWPKIIDAPVTLIFSLGQGGYCNPFCILRQLKIHLWLTTTYRWCDFPGRMTKNCWCSIDAHFHDGAWRVLQSVLPSKAAKNCGMTEYNQFAVWFPRTHDQKLLTLCWCWFSRWVRDCVVVILRKKAANTWILHNNERINFELPDLYDLQLLTLPWCSFFHGCIYHMQSFYLVQSIIHIVMAAFLAFLFTFLLITTLFFNNT